MPNDNRYLRLIHRIQFAPDIHQRELAVHEYTMSIYGHAMLTGFIIGTLLTALVFSFGFWLGNK